MYGAVDIGGTKTLVTVFDKDGKVIEQIKFPTPKEYPEFVKELAATVDKLSTKDFYRTVVAIPGKVDHKNGVGVAFGNLPWKSVPIEESLEKIFNCPVLVENDAKLAGLSEAINVSDEFSEVLYVTISTGIGGGFITDGKIDPRFADMEVGHMLLEYGDKLMRWEEFASGTAFVKKFGKKASEVPEDDTDAWYWLARNVAIGLIDLIATLTPEVIIIGGGVGSHFEKFQRRLQEQLNIYQNPMLTIPPIRKAAHPEEAVVYGCYELAKAHHGKVAHRA